MTPEADAFLTMMAADEDALTAAELAGRLEVSAASISGAVRYLIQVGLMERDPVPGSRRDRYRLPADPWYEGIATKTGLLKQVADLAGGGVEALGGSHTPGGARVAEMRYDFLFVTDEMQELIRGGKPPGAGGGIDARSISGLDQRGPTGIYQRRGPLARPWGAK